MVLGAAAAAVLALAGVSFAGGASGPIDVPPLGGTPPPPALFTRGWPLKISKSRVLRTCFSSSVVMAHPKFGWLMCGTPFARRIPSTIA